MDVITFPENLQTTSGLSILLHGVISLPDATSYNKICILQRKSQITAMIFESRSRSNILKISYIVSSANSFLFFFYRGVHIKQTNY